MTSVQAQSQQEAPYNEVRHIQSVGCAIGETRLNRRQIFSNYPWGERAEMALKAAVEKVVEAHIRDGQAAVIFRQIKFMPYFYALSPLFCSGALCR